MTLVSSGSEIKLKGAGDTNPTGQPTYLDTTITSASTSCSVVGFVREQEGSDVFYTIETTLSGTVYGFKTAQTTEYSGTTRVARGFDDTNPALNGSQVLGSGFLVNEDWFGSTPGGTGTWWTSAGVVGITLGVDENSLGSIGTQSYTGGGSVGTLEVHHFGWFNNSSNSYPNGTVLDTQAEGNWIMLSLKNTSDYPPNTNDSFYSVIINGQEFLRTAAADTKIQSATSSNDSNVSSGTHYYRTWLWSAAEVTDSDLTAIGTTGSKTFKITSSASTTLNTGISEEMSAGTDTDPIEFSDYYKDDIYHATTGIPTSGEIKFSDFYGKTRVALETVLHSTTMLPDYNTFTIYTTNTANSGIRSLSFPTDSAAVFGDDDFVPSNTFLGFTTSDVTIQDVYTNYSNTSSIPANFVDFKVTLDVLTNEATTAYVANDNFSRIDVYDGTDTSGTPFFSVDVSDASVSQSDQGSFIRLFMTWTAANVTATGSKTFANYFGTSTTPSTNGTHTIQFIE